MMVYDIMVFLVLFVCDLLIFASIGTLLFVSSENYSNLNEAMVTLFTSAMGGFDFSILKDTNKGEMVGEIYLIIFLLLNLILILNLLIAILASTYALLEGRKLVLYINEILRLRPIYEYNSNCSALVSSFPPLNGITLLFAPFFFCSRKTKCLNTIVFLVSYFPIFLLASLVFIVIGIIILPFVYLKSIFISIQMLFKRRSETNICFRVGWVFIVLFCGWIFLPINLIVDTLTFWLHLFQGSLNYRREKQEVNRVSVQTYKDLLSKFEMDVREGKEVIEFEELAEHMRDKMKILNKIQGIVFGKSADMNVNAVIAHKGTIGLFHHIHEFN